MKIIQLTAENIKRLVAVEIRPDGHLVQIAGKNGQGKTSVLDSIWWALAGAKHIQSAPIRKGANKARIRIDMGEIVVTRTFIRDKDDDGFTTKLEVVGSVKGSPQAMLDSLLDSLAFDPLKFARMDPAAQFDALKQFVPEVDFDKLAAANSIDMANRKEINRRAKDARVMADQIEVPTNAPAEPVDESALVAELTNAGKHNADIQLRAERRRQTAEKVEQYRKDASRERERAAQLRREADDAEQRAVELDAIAGDAEKKLTTAEALPAPIDVDQLQARIRAARETNVVVERRRKKQEYETLAETLETESRELTNRMTVRETQKLEAIATAQLPIPSLSFGESAGEGVVLLNGVPFDQASDAEQLKASCALAMAGNPQLRVIRVRDGSLLDEDSLKLLAGMAEERDYQVWIERVGSGNVGFVLEDGHVLEPAGVEK